MIRYACLIVSSIILSHLLLSCQGPGRAFKHDEHVIASIDFDKPDTTWNTFQYDRSVNCEWKDTSGRNGTGSIAISGNTLHAKWEKEFPVKANHTYQITVFAKGEGRSYAYLSVNDRFSSKAAYGEFDWTMLSLEYTPDNDKVITVNCNFGYGSGQTIYDGTVWFDDLKISRIR